MSSSKGKEPETTREAGALHAQRMIRPVNTLPVPIETEMDIVTGSNEI
jgi:hypothetical protein